MKPLLKLALGAALLVAAGIVARRHGMPTCEEIQAYAAGGMLKFIGVCALATLLFIPGTLLGLGAGMAFGPALGSLLVVIGSSIGAVAAFGVARLLTPAWRKAPSESRVEWLLFARLSPVVPFNAFNFACGALPVRFGEYALTTIVGIVPGTIAYVYFGSVAGCGSPDKGHLLFALGALTALSFLPLAVAKLRRARADGRPGDPVSGSGASPRS